MLGSGPPPHLPGFLNSLAGPLDHFGYWAVLLFVMIEDFGVPVPGETILIAASVYAGAGRLNVIMVGVIGFVAAVIGDNIGFAIGHYGGRALVLRWGRYVRLTRERLDKAEAFFGRHGAWIITIARFIEGLRQANGIIAGIIGMRWLRFLAFNALGAALWVGTWVTLGYLAGSHIGTIYHYITPVLLLCTDRAGRAARGLHWPADASPRPPYHPQPPYHPARERAKDQPSNGRPAASDTASTQQAASQPSEARHPHQDS